MNNDTVVINPRNTGPHMDRLWVFISRDKEGHENACGSIVGTMGMQPLMTGNPKILELMKPIARALAESCAATGKTVHLLSFTNREEIENW